MVGTITTERMPAAAESRPCPMQIGTERDSMRELVLSAAEAVVEDVNEDWGKVEESRDDELSS